MQFYVDVGLTISLPLKLINIDPYFLGHYDSPPKKTRPQR